jgi:thiamine-phosphate pyrophosphorylase
MDALRILDADGNRAAEGLRALEDAARFLLADAVLAGRLKEARHAVRRAVPAASIAWRDSAADVGEGLRAADEGAHPRLSDHLRANAARCAEALRSGAEAARLAGEEACARALEAVRYEVYRIESALLARLPAWRFRAIRLYVLVDSALCADPVAVAAAAARGGAGCVQLRAKDLGLRAYRELAARMQDAVRAQGALFCVNDHAAVARVLASDALHLGQDDLAPADARLVVGPLCALGVSAHTPEQAEAAAAAGADYLGLGPVHATATKAHEPERGPGLLDAVRGSLRLPSFAIGGLDAERIRALRGRIPHGVAVAGAVCRSPDPERACAELRAALDHADA